MQLYLNHRSSHRRCSAKKGVGENFVNFTGKYLFLIKWQTFRYSNTGVFLWNLRNFEEHLLWRTSANDCSWNTLHCGSSSSNTPGNYIFLKEHLRKAAEATCIFFNVMALHFKIRRRIQHPVKHIRCFCKKLLVRCLTGFRVPLWKKRWNDKKL